MEDIVLAVTKNSEKFKRAPYDEKVHGYNIFGRDRRYIIQYQENDISIVLDVDDYHFKATKVIFEKGLFKKPYIIEDSLELIKNVLSVVLETEEKEHQEFIKKLIE